MQIKIHLRNFQAVEKADIELNTGLTMVVGLNNHGKSCLFRAIESVVWNNPRKTKRYIKTGTKKCIVQIEVEGYETVTWIKTPDSVEYRIGKQKYTKAGKTNLIELMPNHPFVVYEDTLFNLLRQGKKSVPFDRPSSSVFNLVESMYDIIDSQKDLKVMTSMRATLSTAIKKEEIEKEELKEKIKRIEEVEGKVSQDKITKLLNKVKGIQKKSTTLKNIDNFIQVHNTLSATGTLGNLQEYCNTTPTQFQTLLHKDKVSHTLSSNITLLQKLKHLNIAIQQVEPQTDLATLHSKLSQMDTLLSNKQFLKKLATINKELIPLQMDINLYAQTSMRTLPNILNTLELFTKLKHIQEQKEETQDYLNNITKTLQVCPYCNQPLGKEHKAHV